MKPKFQNVINQRALERFFPHEEVPETLDEIKPSRLMRQASKQSEKKQYEKRRKPFSKHFEDDSED